MDKTDLAISNKDVLHVDDPGASTTLKINKAEPFLLEIP
jgi:hypothetical protein